MLLSPKKTAKKSLPFVDTSFAKKLTLHQIYSTGIELANFNKISQKEYRLLHEQVLCKY